MNSKKQHKRILFLDDCNGFEKDSIAHVVEIPSTFSIEVLARLEMGQIGVNRMGGKWRKIMEDGRIEYNILEQGRESDFTTKDYDEVYRLISGNY